LNDLNYFKNLISSDNSNHMFSCLCKREKILSRENRELKRELNQIKTECKKLNTDLNFYKSHCHQNAICFICNDNPREYANVSCGHCIACNVCAPKLLEKCPICNTYGRFKKIIMS